MNDSTILIYQCLSYSAVDFVTDLIRADTSIKSLAVLRHYFNLELKANVAALRIWEMEGNETISKCNT